MRVDFFARRAHYIDHIAPIWNALPMDRRGVFITTEDLRAYAGGMIDPDAISIYDGQNVPGWDPVLTASYGDMIRAARNLNRKIISCEHGTGHAFGTAAYPDGKGKRDLVSLFLMPNEYTARKSQSVRSTPCEVIGTPKMDEYIPALRPRISNNPVIAIAFHWGDGNANPPESGNAWEHYKDILPALAERYNVIGHGHPLSVNTFRPAFKQAGIEFVENFRDVLQRADIYINDLSSTMYEFLVTGKPVIVLNAPWFRRDVHWGIRFWEWSNVGINVEDPGRLFNAIDNTIEHYNDICLVERFQAVVALYPYLGHSAQRAAEVITMYLREWESE